MTAARRALAAAFLLAALSPAMAQPTRDLGLPPPFDNPALPPAVNPALPPPTGQRYLPGTSGPFADPDRAPALPRALSRGFRLESLIANVRRSEEKKRPDRVAGIADLRDAIRSCWSPPADESDGTIDGTLRFSLRRDGALAAEPRATYVHRAATPARREALLASARAALARCAPFTLSPGFSRAAAGRPISIRFILDAAGRR